MSAAMCRSGRRGLVVVGGGMAAGRLLQSLVNRGYDGRITLLSGEPELPYNRVLLPEVLGGTLDESALHLNAASWYSDSDIDLQLGVRVTAIDTGRNRVFLSHGRSIRFDRLVLANGSNVPIDRIPGAATEGVSVFRSLADTRRLQQLIGVGGRVTIVGGGLLGLETAQSFLDCGVRVRVLHRQAHVLNRQLDASAAGIVQRHLAAQGVNFHLGRRLNSIRGGERVAAVVLDDGSEFETDAVVFATGSRPDDALARQAGLACDGGVLVNDRLETSTPGVYAIGECARVGGRSHALVAPVNRQAETLAKILCGGVDRFSPGPETTRLKVRGIDVFCAGVCDDAGDDRVLVEDGRRGIYRRLDFRDSRLIGAMLIGDTSGSRQIQQLIEEATQVSDRAAVAFGYSQAPALRSAA